MTNASKSYRGLLNAAIGGCLGFAVLTAIAMVIYPGGTAEHFAETHYRFFENFFSDLGRTRTFRGQSNVISMTLFIGAMACGSVGLAGFFTAFAGAARGRLVSRMLSLFGAVSGIASAVCFMGVGLTPWDLYMQLHIGFVLWAFRLLLMATMLDSIAVLTDRSIPRRMIGPFAVFTCLLIGYIILLTAGMSGGPAADDMLQATGQKIIVYAAILMVMVQSLLLRRGFPPVRV